MLYNKFIILSFTFSPSLCCKKYIYMYICVLMRQSVYDMPEERDTYLTFTVGRMLSRITIRLSLCDTYYRLDAFCFSYTCTLSATYRTLLFARSYILLREIRLLIIK